MDPTKRVTPKRAHEVENASQQTSAKRGRNYSYEEEFAMEETKPEKFRHDEEGDHQTIQQGLFEMFEEKTRPFTMEDDEDEMAHRQSASNMHNHFAQQQQEKRRPTYPESSTNGRWKPISFAMANLYDFENGVPLPRHICEENLMKLVRNDKESDYFEYLELAQQFHGVSVAMEKMAVGMAYSTVMMNKVLRRLKSKERSSQPLMEFAEKFVDPRVLQHQSLVVMDRGFNLTEAKASEKLVVLPSGYSFRISDIITPYVASNWNSSRFDTDCKTLFRTALKKVSSYDPYFSAYAGPENSSTGYVPVGEYFYKTVARFAIAGFGQHQTVELETKVIKMARDVLSNLLDRVRQAFNATGMSCKDIATELNKMIATREKIEIKVIDFNSDPPTNYWQNRQNQV